LELNKSLEQFASDEKFLEKFLDQYTKLEHQFLKQIDILEQQVLNNAKLSGSFGNLGQIQKLADAGSAAANSSHNASSSGESVVDKSRCFEKLMHTSQLASQVFSSLQKIKNDDVQFEQKKLKLPMHNIRLMIVAGLSSCQRRRMLVKYNHEKKQEIKKF